MATHIVGIGALAVSRTKGDLIRTFGLGSCIGMVMVDPETSITGMLHFVLPEASINVDKSRLTPAYFADTGVPALIAAMEALGTKHNRRWVVKVAGGAKVLSASGSDALDIGKRNILAAKKCLWKYGLAAIAEDTAKTHSRTISITVGSVELAIANRQVGDTTI
jgi:chemotaxis protein CheD